MRQKQDVFSVSMTAEEMEDAMLDLREHKKLKELVASFTGGFMERGSGHTIYRRIPPPLAARLRSYIDQMKELVK